jgi:hypothetical protein
MESANAIEKMGNLNYSGVTLNIKESKFNDWSNIKL